MVVATVHHANSESLHEFEVGQLESLVVEVVSWAVL
jgi:hypothetical protein